MEQELIKIETRDGRQVVSARELYIGIGFDLSDGNFSRWIKKQLEDVDAVENEDYIVNVFKDVNPNGGKPITDYIITVDIAKEICMVIGVTPRCKDEVKQKSKQIRKYFIECEKQLKEVVKITKEDELILNVVKAKDVGTRMIALSEYGEYKENRIREQEVKPLQEEVKKLSPLAETLIKRFEKGENISLTDVTKTFGLKRGQVSKWAIKQGLIYKNKKDVTNKGDIYFQRYVINGFKNICITPQGVQLIEQHLEEIKAL